MDRKTRIALATGSEELNQAVVKSTQNQNYEYTQVHYREFFFDKEIEQNFDICIISKLLPGEKNLDKLIFFLKGKNIRVLMILLDQDKEELETCIKYQISDVLTQPVKPIDILNTIENPKKFKDIEFIYKKLGLKFEFEENKQEKAEKAKKPLINIFNKRNKRARQKEKQSKIESPKSEKPEPEIEVISNENKISNTEPGTKSKEVEIQKEYRLVRAKKISFVNLSRGAGSTFLSLNTAYAMVNFGVKPSVIELPGIANIFYQIADEADDYIPLAWKIENEDKDYDNTTYMKDNINFYINNGKHEYRNWNTDKEIKFINASAAKADVNLFDVGDSLNSYVLKNTDKIIVVVDPAPHKLLNAIDRLSDIKNLAAEYSISTVFVLNKWIEKLDKKDIEKYLQIKNSICIPFVSPEIYYEAAYNNQVIYQNNEGQSLLGNGLHEIINEIIPYGRTKQKRRLFIK